MKNVVLNSLVAGFDKKYFEAVKEINSCENSRSIDLITFRFKDEATSFSMVAETILEGDDLESFHYYVADFLECIENVRDNAKKSLH